MRKGRIELEAEALVKLPHERTLTSLRKHMPKSHTLAETAFALLSSMKYNRKEYRDKGRRIAGRKLPGVMWGNPNIFQHKVKTRVDTAASITCLVDLSGSMTVEKVTVAGCGAAIVAEMCRGFHMPCAIEGFTESEYTGHGCMHFVFKRRNKNVETDELLVRIAKASKFKAQNADGDSIYYAWHRILEQTKGERELLIVFSDGQPAADRDGDILGYTKDVIRMIEDDGRVEIYGIGIEDRTVKNLYRRHRVVERIDELERAIVEVLTSHMLGELT